MKIKDFLEVLISSIGIFSIRALFISDSHQIISREGIEYINKLQDEKDDNFRK
jgi:hypothetical protein